MVDIDFFLTALVSLLDEMPLVGGILGHVRGSEVVLIALEFTTEGIGSVDACSLGVSHLLLVEHKAVYILLERLALDLLLIVLVIKVLKLREFDVFAVNGHENRIPFGYSEDRSSQQQ